MPKQDKKRVALLEKSIRKDEIPAKKDSNFDVGKKGSQKNGEKNQNIKFGNIQKNSKKKNKEIKNIKEKLDKFEQVLKSHSLIFQNNNLVFNIYNIRISNLEKDNVYLRSAYKVLFYRKISNSFLKKIFIQKNISERPLCYLKIKLSK